MASALTDDILKGTHRMRAFHRGIPGRNAAFPVAIDIAATEENTLFRCHHLFSGREKYPNARDTGSRVHAYRRMR